MEGEYDYDEDVPRDVFRRHENCRCTVVCKPVKGKVSDVHSKKQFETARDARIANSERIAQKNDQQLTPAQRENRAKAIAQRNMAMDLGSGEKYQIIGRINDPTIFAGKGTKTVYRDADKFAEKYGGRVEDWKHGKGVGIVDVDGEHIRAALHWSEIEGLGRVEIFVKEWLE